MKKCHINILQFIVPRHYPSHSANNITTPRQSDRCRTAIFCRNYSPGIDGLLLTKYDTVDDKVGAALSMVYVSGQPIVFVGTGQKYPNLKRLRPEEICNQLLS